jgi:hypothetical protein
VWNRTDNASFPSVLNLDLDMGVCHYLCDAEKEQKRGRFVDRTNGPDRWRQPQAARGAFEPFDDDAFARPE